MLVKKNVSFCFRNDEEPFDNETFISLSDISRFDCCAYSFNFKNIDSMIPVQVMCIRFDHYCMLFNNRTDESCLFDYQSPDESLVVDFFYECCDFDDEDALEEFVTEFLSMFSIRNQRYSKC